MNDETETPEVTVEPENIAVDAVEEVVVAPPPVPGAAHGQDDHDEGPTGVDGFAPDNPPTGMLGLLLVGMVLFVAASFIGLHQFLGIQAEQERVGKLTASPELTALREASTQTLTHFGFDADAQQYKIPLAQAKEFLLKNPGKLSVKAMWPELNPRIRPEPKKK